jgi:hypothetical protein
MPQETPKEKQHRMIFSILCLVRVFFVSKPKWFLEDRLSSEEVKIFP